MHRFFHALLVFILATSFLSCEKPSQDAQSAYSSIPVCATIPAIANLVRQIGGVRVKVDCLIPNGSDPTTFEPTEDTRIRLGKSKVFFYGDNSYEQKIKAVASSINGLKPILVGAVITKEQRIMDSVTGREVEPAFWGDASLWDKCIQDVFDGLVKLDPQSRDVFEQNVTYFRENLLTVHNWSIRRAQEIPPLQRLIITPTDNLRYFAKAYGFETLTVQNEDDVSKAVEAIRERGIRTIYSEVGMPIGKIADVANLSGATINSEVYGFGAPDRYKMENYQAETYDISTYPGMMKHNVNNFVQGLH